MYNKFIGIDVSKDKIDVFCSETSTVFQVENSEKPLAEKFKNISPENTLVILENTGGYEDKTVCVLHKLKFDIHRTNNNKLKNFIRSYGIKAKTDSIDARGLALYGQERHQELELLSPIA